MAAACSLAAVGVVWWDGTGTSGLTVPQAAAIASDPNVPPEQRKLAAIALRRAASTSIRALIQLAEGEDQAGACARNALELLNKELQKR